MAQVCLDLHDAIGCKWGDNPYLTISQLKAAAQPAPVQEPKPACWQGEDGCPNRQACCDAQHCLYTTPPAEPVQLVDIAALVEGMEVSIDVSTGDHDNGNRLFGTVTLAQENQGSKHGLILLVQDPEANFKTTTPPAAPVPLTEQKKARAC
jgi:hypothetical protein